MNENTLKVMYVEHHDWLWGWLRKKLGCAENAADLTQDTFVKLLSDKFDLSNIKEPRAYLTTIASRLIVDRYRRKKIEEAYLQRLANSEAAMATDPSAEHVVNTIQMLVSIAEMLEGLPEKPRTAFLMSRLDGMRHKEIADALGVSVSMVKKYIAQAMVHCYRVDDDV